MNLDEIIILKIQNKQHSTETFANCLTDISKHHCKNKLLTKMW